MRTRKIQKQAFAVCLAIMTAAQTMTGYGATITAGGAPDHGSWVREGQNWRYQAADGSFAKGWIHTASGWYYLDPDTGVMKTGKTVIDGKQYYFDQQSDGLEGRMHTGWIKDEKGAWYFYSTNADVTEGAMVSGWQWIDGRCYYFEPESGEHPGKMFTNGTTPDGYPVDQDGAWLDENGKVQERPGQGYSGMSGQNRASGSTQTSSGGSSGSGSGSSSSGSGSSSNGSGSGSGTSSGNTNSNPSSPGTSNGRDEQQSSLLLESQTRVVDLGWSQYVSVAFAKGYSLNNCRVMIDGVDVTEAMTPVDTDGTIAKWELTVLNPGSITAMDPEGHTQTVSLGGSQNGSGMIQVRKHTAPSAFLAHGSVNVWDYQLTNYDDHGQVRVKPSTTTFSLGQKKDEIRYYAPKAELKDDETADNVYHVSGEAIVMFNYTSEADKQWFDSISDVDLVSGNGNKNTINADLTWSSDLADHHGKTVGQITVPLGQTNFYSNGLYYLRVKSGNTDTLIPIEVVNGTAPSMILSEAGAIVSGKNLHFTVQNMTYGATMPVNRVELKRPDGTTEDLEKIRDWYLIGDSFVLYNDESATNGRNNIPVPGKYTITVHATGFKDMSYTFTVSDAASAVREEAHASYTLAAVDAISSATVSGGSSSGSSDGSDGGSTTMTADLIFDADLLANALILSKLQVENEAADAIADRWLSDMSGYDAVIGEDRKTFYSFKAYRDAVEQAKNAGTYLSFADYLAAGNAETTPNRPYAVKYVLEDNLLGETQMNGNYLGKEAPVIHLTDETGNTITEIKEGTDVYLSCEDLAYLKTVAEEAKLYVNGDYQELSNTKYALTESGRLLRLDADVFRLEKDSNTLVIKLDGYQDNTVSVPVVKDKKDVHLSVEENLKVGDAVILTNDADESGDIWKHITKVSLKKPDGTVKNIRPDGQENIWEKVGYSISEEQKNQLILGKDLFDTEGEYEVTIEATYYENQTITFEISKADQTDPGETNPDEAKEPPAAVDGEDSWGAYTFRFGTDFCDWIKNISDVSVNGKPYEKGNYVYGSAQYTISETDGFVMLGNQEITEDKNKIVISVAGYEDLTFYIDKTGKLVDETSDPDTENKETLAEPVEIKGITDGFSLQFDDAEWFDKITTVTVNETEYQKADYDLNRNEYRTSLMLKQILLSNFAFQNSEENEVVIEAEGYEDLAVTITLDQNGKISDGLNGDIGNEDGEENAAPEVSTATKDTLSGNYTVTLSGEKLDDWFDAIKLITLNETELTAVSNSFYLEQNKYLLRPTDCQIYIGKNSLTESENEIVISADGYQNLTFMLDQNGALIAEEHSEAAIMLVSDEEEASDDDQILDEDTIISDDSDEKSTDQDRMDSAEGKDSEDKKKQTDAAESKNTNDSKSNQQTAENDAKEDAEEVKKDTLVDDDSSSEEAQDPDTEDNKDAVAITEDQAEE
ncbi:hemoblobin-interacting domain-containing protein [Clostridium sp. OM02-18AC]|uniref:hemoblobin-interacting domain-containing protein n=1 Tax=Clostridium sp. OM02-18AC TaxID=2292311 RepID=UPI0015FB2FBB|nr:hemoblobin-interacting domain-containing protein [Clostridium sp. OM02-18AC]